MCLARVGLVSSTCMEILVLEVEERRRGNGGCSGRARARIEER